MGNEKLPEAIVEALGFSFFPSNLPVQEPQQTLLPKISGNADENKEVSINERLRGQSESTG